ncbi:MAG TPA: MmcQ/YjbR family DNA-binding protein [Gaiellaceae bacterium]|nr:MmcQ/YjbR family DNA-binding protein [Gaiellaceae bacterium]
MADLDALALELPQVTRDVSDDGRPTYSVHGKMFCFHRSRRPDAVDAETGERLDDVLVFRVGDLDEKELLLADRPEVFFTTPHWNGYPAVLMRIPDLAEIQREELRELVVDAWLTRAQKRVAKAWLAEHEDGGEE